MNPKHLGLVLLAALLFLAPLTSADGNQTAADPDRPDDAAWVEDCPPDMMCAFSDTPEEVNETRDNDTRGPADCEYCRYGPDDCIDCSGMPVPGGEGIQAEDCPPGVYCMADGASGDHEAQGHGAARSEDAPLGIVAVGTLVLVGVAALARRRA